MHIYIKIHYICSNYFTINYHIMKKTNSIFDTIYANIYLYRYMYRMFQPFSIDRSHRSTIERIWNQKNTTIL